jgi:hypothetical protein
LKKEEIYKKEIKRNPIKIKQKEEIEALFGEIKINEKPRKNYTKNNERKIKKSRSSIFIINNLI